VRKREKLRIRTVKRRRKEVLPVCSGAEKGIREKQATELTRGSKTKGDAFRPAVGGEVALM